MEKIHIFRAGCHVAMNGARFCFSPADLVDIVGKYDPAIHRAPLVLGHPTTDNPAYGWVEYLQTEGSDLNAFAQITDELVEHVRAGRYRHVSASFYVPGDPSNPLSGVYYLRHVGFLGATPPAVKGLQEPRFAEPCVRTTLDIDSACDCAFAASADSALDDDIHVPDGYTVDAYNMKVAQSARALVRGNPGMSFSEAVDHVVERRKRLGW